MIPLAQRKHHSWPSDARCVVGLTLDFDGTSLERGRGQLPFGARSHGRYSAKCGIPRFVDMFTRQNVPWTFYVSGYDAEESPDLVRDISRSGIEIGSHGYFHEGVDPGDAEPELLERTHRLLAEITGIAPRGWRSPSGHKTARTLRAPHGRLTQRTLGHLADLGYRYDASFQDDDQPYSLDADGGRGMIEVPHAEILIDATLYGQRQTHDRVMKMWREEIEAMYRERCLITLTLHPRSDYGSARASRVAALDGLLTWLRNLDGVAFLTCEEIAGQVRP